MKRIILLTLCILSLCGSAWGTTYYVRTDGNDTRCTGLVNAADTGSGTSQPCAKLTIEAGTALIHNSDTLNVLSGTYTQAASAYGLVDGRSNVTMTGGYGGGTTIWDFSTTNSGDGSEHFYWNGTGGTLQDFTFRGEWGSGKTQVYMNSGGTVKNNIFQDSAIGLQAKGTLSVYKNQFLGSSQTAAGNYSIRVAGGATTAYENIFRKSTSSPTINPVYTTNASNLNLYNNVFDNLTNDAISLQSDAGATYNIQNNQLLDLGHNTTDLVVRTGSATATVNFDHNFLTPVLLFTGATSYGTGYAPGATITFNQSNNSYSNPGMKSFPRFGAIMLDMDDQWPGYDSQLLLAPLYNPYGIKIATPIPYYRQSLYSAAATQAFINAGNDMAWHSDSHTDMLVYNPITVTGRSGYAPTMKVSVNRVNPNDSTTWTGQVLMYENAALVKTIQIDTLRLSDLISSIHAQSGWSVVQTNKAGPDAKAVMLADTGATPVDVSAGAVFNYDTTAFWQVEVYEAKTKMENYIRTGAAAGSRAANYTIKWFVSPNDDVNDTAVDQYALAGAKGARGPSYASLGTWTWLGNDSTQNPTNFDIYHIYNFGDISFRNAGGGYGGPTTATGGPGVGKLMDFSSGAGTITINSTTSAATGLQAGDVIEVLNTTSNNTYTCTTGSCVRAAGPFTISTIADSGGNSVITISGGSLITETGTNGLILCQAKWRRNVDTLVKLAYNRGLYINILMHPLAIGGYNSGAQAIDLSLLEHYWLSNELGTAWPGVATQKVNDFLDNVWNLGASPQGNNWSVAAGSTSTPDHTLRFGLTFADQTDYHLTASSTAIGTGTNTPITGMVSLTDFGGSPITNSAGTVLSRSIGGATVSTVDIGTYSYLEPLSIAKTSRKVFGAKGGYLNYNPSGYTWSLVSPPAGATITPSGTNQITGTVSGAGAKKLDVHVTDGLTSTDFLLQLLSGGASFQNSNLEFLY